MITQKIIARTDSLKLDKIISRYGEDSMRQVVFIVVRPEPDSEELIPITIPEDAVGSFRILKPSGNFVIVPMNKSVLASGETAFDVVIPASANTAKGSGYYDIRITSDTDKYYFTAQGDFLIDDNIISDEVLEDVSEVNGLIFPDDFLTVEDHVAYIDDDTISTDSTWSSNKINEEIEAHSGGDVSKTVSGNPITFTDGASAPLVRCEMEIQGSQDLHGYDKPWVGGAGKNKLPMTVDGIKSVNRGGTWSGNAYTISGVTFSILTDSGENVVGIATSGTSSNYIYFNLAYVDAESGIIINGAPTGGDQYKWFQAIDTTSDFDYGNGATISTSVTNKKFMIVVANGVNMSNKTFYPMIRLSTETDPTFAPYSNICPITAYTEGEIEVSDGDGNVTTHTTTFPSVIYRGSEDVVKGEVTSEMPVIDLEDLTWTKDGNNYRARVTGIKRPEIAGIKGNGVCSHYPIVPQASPTANTISFLGWMDGIIFWGYDIYETVEDFIAAMSGVQLAYELATPTTSSVTPTNLPIKSLSGYNHIESSTGEMEIEYITQRFQPLIDSIKQL